MKNDIVEFVSRCPTCQQVKAEHKHLGGKLVTLEVLEWKWEHITMDFVVGLPKTLGGYDAIWVIVDRLTKTARFITVKMTFTLEKLANLYIMHVARLHGVP